MTVVSVILGFLVAAAAHYLVEDDDEFALDDEEWEDTKGPSGKARAADKEMSSKLAAGTGIRPSSGSSSGSSAASTSARGTRPPARSKFTKAVDKFSLVDPATAVTRKGSGGPAPPPPGFRASSRPAPRSMSNANAFNDAPVGPTINDPFPSSTPGGTPPTGVRRSSSNGSMSGRPVPPSGDMAGVSRGPPGTFQGASPRMSMQLPPIRRLSGPQLPQRPAAFGTLPPRPSVAGMARPGMPPRPSAGAGMPPFMAMPPSRPSLGSLGGPGGRPPLPPGLGSNISPAAKMAFLRRGSQVSLGQQGGAAPKPPTQQPSDE